MIETFRVATFCYNLEPTEVVVECTPARILLQPTKAVAENTLWFQTFAGAASRFAQVHLWLRRNPESELPAQPPLRRCAGGCAVQPASTNRIDEAGPGRKRGSWEQSDNGATRDAIGESMKNA